MQLCPIINLKKNIMKNLKTTIAILAITLFASSCSKKEEPVIKQLSKPLNFTNNNSVAIPDPPFPSAPGFISSIINVNNETGIISDKNKITLEMNVQHPDKRDLTFSLQAPDGSVKFFVYRIGNGAGKYIGTNKLRFNATFTDAIPASVADVANGNYKESFGSSYTSQNLEPIFSFLQGKQIQGEWKLYAYDYQFGDVGSIISWSLIFGEGALQ
jgi:subtilisin-like proprotein convertase family protein